MYPWLNNPYDQLAQRVNQGRLHHALLIKGIQGIGKRNFSLEFAHYLLCHNKQGNDVCGQCQACKLFTAASHPDLHQIESDKQIGVDLIREGIQKLTGTAQMSGNKVLIIQEADSMTESAANALLKTLEEPTTNTYLLLVCSDTEGLLPTILSRCEKVELHGPNRSGCREWLQQNGQQDVTDNFIQIYANAPLRILDALTKESTVGYQSFILGVQSIQQGKTLAADMAVKWQESERSIIKWLEHLIMLELKSHPMNDALWQLHASCLDATQAILNPGINKALLLSGLLQQLPAINTIETGEQKRAG